MALGYKYLFNFLSGIGSINNMLKYSIQKIKEYSVQEIKDNLQRHLTMAICITGDFAASINREDIIFPLKETEKSYIDYARTVFDIKKKDSDDYIYYTFLIASLYFLQGHSYFASVKIRNIKNKNILKCDCGEHLLYLRSIITDNWNVIRPYENGAREFLLLSLSEALIRATIYYDKHGYDNKLEDSFYKTLTVRQKIALFMSNMNFKSIKFCSKWYRCIVLFFCIVYFLSLYVIVYTEYTEKSLSERVRALEEHIDFIEKHMIE